MKERVNNNILNKIVMYKLIRFTTNKLQSFGLVKHETDPISGNSLKKKNGNIKENND